MAEAAQRHQEPAHLKRRAAFEHQQGDLLSSGLRQRLPVLQLTERPGILDLGWGHPHASLLPVAEWAAAVQEASRSFGWQALTYGYAAGPGPLIEWLAEHLSRVEPGASEASQFFVTAGASHALALVSTVLTEPGDIVLVDSPTYHFALRILLDRGVRIVKAPTDDEGIDPAALDGLLDRLLRRGQRVPMLYIVPTFCNPTGRSLPGHRRRDLVRLALRTGLTIVEDDTYRELAYAGPAPVSLWRLAEGQAVVRIGSFSKTVAPGLRLGWINADRRIVHRLMSLGYIDSGGGVNHAAALAMAVFGTSGAYHRHVTRVRQAYQLRRDTLTDALHGCWPGPDVPSPAGGWFLWLPLLDGITARMLLPAAERHGVSFVAGTEFYPGAQGGEGAQGAQGGEGTQGAQSGERAESAEGGENHIRLSFSLLTPPQLAEAAERLAAAITTLRS